MAKLCHYRENIPHYWTFLQCRESTAHRSIPLIWPVIHFDTSQAMQVSTYKHGKTHVAVCSLKMHRRLPRKRLLCGRQLDFHMTTQCQCFIFRRPDQAIEQTAGRSIKWGKGTYRYGISAMIIVGYIHCNIMTLPKIINSNSFCLHRERHLCLH